MPERCTCGAQLPPEALFCHKCGRAQRELLEAEPDPFVAPPPPIRVAAPAAPAPIGFHNGPAVRVALLAGVLSILIWGIGAGLAPPAFFPVWMILGGMLTAFLYKVRTGQRLSAIGGARLGWISGIFGFAIIGFMLAIFAAAMLHNPATVSTLHEQLAQAGRPSSDLDTFLEAVRHPGSLMLALSASFLLFTVLSAFGGAIGARLLDRD